MDTFDSCHIWQAYLPDLEKWQDRYFCVLAPAEKERASRFKTPDLQKQFIIWHGVLKTILGSYLNIAPTDVRFVYSPHGKPSLDLQRPSKKLYFNMSHSNQYALFAFSETVVGIDIEYIDSYAPPDDLAAQNFSTKEIETFNSLPDNAKTEAFFNCWTRKEAFVKALGEGLSYPLKDFDVTLKPGESAKLLEIRRPGADASEWSLHDIEVGMGYKAVLAVHGRPTQILYRSVAGI